MVRLAWSATAAACAMAMLVLMLFETRNSKTTVTIHDGASFENKTLKIIELLQSVKELLKPPAARDDSVMPPFIFPQLYRCKKTMQEVQSLPAEHASQSREDIWLYEKIFSFLPENDLIGGTFLEIGALDGRTFSNTLYFEKKWDWRGILIEGHPANQPALRAAQDFRQNSAIFTTAICELTEDGAVQTLTFTTSGGAVGAALEHANTGFLSSWHNGDKGDDIFFHPQNRRLISAQQAASRPIASRCRASSTRPGCSTSTCSHWTSRAPSSRS